MVADSLDFLLYFIHSYMTFLFDNAPIILGVAFAFVIYEVRKKQKLDRIIANTRPSKP